MILKGHRTMRMVMATTSELAEMAHIAENEGDDLTAIGLMEELEVREQKIPGTTNVFRMAYMDQMKRLGCPTDSKP